MSLTTEVQYTNDNLFRHLILQILICRVFQVVTNIGRLVEVDLASLLKLQVLKDDRVGAHVEKVEEDNWFDRDIFENIFHKNTNPAQ